MTRYILFFTLLYTSLGFSATIDPNTCSNFDWKCWDMMEFNEHRKCNAYIDRKLRKGRLSKSDEAIAYFYKASLFLTYEDWNSRKRKRDWHNGIDYPYSYYVPAEWMDSSYYYTHLYLIHASDAEKKEREWIKTLYTPLYKTTLVHWENTVAEFTKNENVSNRRNAYRKHFHQIKLLQEFVARTHPFNQFSLAIRRIRLKYESTGKISDKNQQEAYHLLQNCAQNEFLYSRYCMMNQFTVSQDDLYSEFAQLISALFRAEDPLGKKMLAFLPKSMTPSNFEVFQQYNAYWLPKDGHIDCSTKENKVVYQESGITGVDIEIMIDHIIPTWDTLRILELRSEYTPSLIQRFELPYETELTGSGTTALTLRLFHTTIHTDTYVNPTFYLITNRGEKRISLSGILSPTASENDYPDSLTAKKKVYTHSDGQLISIDFENLHLDTLRIYSHPTYDHPICEIYPQANFTASRVLFPLSSGAKNEYHFQIYQETPDAFQVGWSNYYFEYKFGWIKKEDLQSASHPIEENVNYLTWDTFFTPGTPVTQRNSCEGIHTAPYTFSEKNAPSCQRFIFNSFDEDNKHWMNVSPCEHCHSDEFPEGAKRWIKWRDDEWILVERE